MTEEEFVKYVKKECRNNNVKCILTQTGYLRMDGIPCSGMFYEVNGNQGGILKVAMKNDLAYEILVHEYCHMTQWIDKIDEWKKHQRIDSLKFTGWLRGNKCKSIKKYIEWIIALELDNEKRSVNVIKKLNLDFIDIDLYIKRANAYLQFYNWVLENRQWATKNKPIYKSDEVISLVPAKFNMNYSRIPYKLSKAMSDYYNSD